VCRNCSLAIEDKRLSRREVVGELKGRRVRAKVSLGKTLPELARVLARSSCLTRHVQLHLSAKSSDGRTSQGQTQFSVHDSATFSSRRTAVKMPLTALKTVAKAQVSVDTRN